MSEKENKPFVPRHLVRYANIGVAAGFAVMLIGGLVFRGSESAMHAVWVVSFITTFGILHFLDERNKARERREGKEPQ